MKKNYCRYVCRCRKELIKKRSTVEGLLRNCVVFIDLPLEGPGGNKMIEDCADTNILRDDDHLPQFTYT